MRTQNREFVLILSFIKYLLFSTQVTVTLLLPSPPYLPSRTLQHRSLRLPELMLQPLPLQMWAMN